MIFAAALVALHVALFAWGAIDDAAAPFALPLGECVLALIALAIAPVRRGLLAALIRYWPAALLFAALIVLALHAVWDDGAAERFKRDDAWRLVGFGLAALTAVGAGLAAGRRRLHTVLLIGAVVLGALAVIAHLQANRALFTAPGEAAALFALLSLFSLYAVIDALGVRSARPMERRATRAERLFLPAVALLASLTGLATANPAPSLGALSLGVAALAGVLALRERRGGAGPILLGALAVAALAAGVAFLYLTHRAAEAAPGAPWRASLGAVVAGAAWLAFLVCLALTPDRRRRPSRGLAIALAGAAILAFAAGAGGSAPFATLALLIGIAAAQADELASLSSEPRSSDPP